VRNKTGENIKSKLKQGVQLSLPSLIKDNLKPYFFLKNEICRKDKKVRILLISHEK
jgi:hypothetical protein